MKAVITWSIIFIAFIVAAIETYYGNPNRLIAYILLILFMWIYSKGNSKMRER